ncbi:hypothetical protein [Vibrio metschnikovii]|uniref:hypothetical protein n=1 Tax=Vibrio metschnikovii TaxID=28172 RepID=UPI001C2F32CC|nr:hypothetical protein [Vibrio metschnikovii]
MEASEVINFLSELVKPGSAILGCIIIFQYLHNVFDSSRVYKIKQLELLHSCMKDRDNIGSVYVIEKLIEHTYKIHIPYDQAMVIMKHSERQKLFGLYRASHKYLEFNHKQFSLLSKFDSSRAVWIEKLKRRFINTFKYYVSAFIGGVFLVVAFNLFFANGLLNIQFGVHNIIWFLACILVSSVLIKIAVNSLMDPIDITRAKIFQESFNSKKKHCSVLAYC